MCYFTLETYHFCRRPAEQHPTKLWYSKKCDIFDRTLVQCPDLQYRASFDPVACFYCLYAHSLPPLNPQEPVYEFNNMTLLIPYMKARFDALREDDLAREAERKGR